MSSASPTRNSQNSRNSGPPALRYFLVTLLALVFTAGLLAGCGAAGTAAAGEHAQTASTSPTASVARVRTAPTATQPVVTVDPVTTTVPAADLPGKQRPTIMLGTMNTPEQFILGALYSIALTQAGYTVDVSNNIGKTSVSQSALKDGTLDVYPEYLNTWDEQVAGLDGRFASAAAAYRAGARYATAHGFALLRRTPGEDTTGFAVTTQFARENHVRSLSDLAHAPLLNIGVPLNFGGLWRAETAYGFKAGVVENVLTGTQYTDLDSGLVQVSYVLTTDPELSEPQYTLLADPKNVYGYGNVVPVTTPKVIKAEGPAFMRIINRVDALLTTQALRGLNYEIQIKQDDETAVAEQFLQGNGLLPADVYSAAG